MSMRLALPIRVACFVYVVTNRSKEDFGSPFPWTFLTEFLGTAARTFARLQLAWLFVDSGVDRGKLDFDGEGSYLSLLYYSYAEDAGLGTFHRFLRHSLHAEVSRGYWKKDFDREISSCTIPTQKIR